MRGKTATIILMIAFFGGLILLLYPSVSNWYNMYHQSRVVVQYTENVDQIDLEIYQKMLRDAKEYNEKLSQQTVHNLSEEELEVYDQQLNFGEDGVMAYIWIPKIDVNLPIYHGTSDAVLQTAIGHLEWSSLPVGGESSHCVLSGHRGMPSAKLFTDLPSLGPGDWFTITTLKETLTYEVFETNTVKPSDLSLLQICEGEDLCTLSTCTPYGINTERFLVRARRIESEDIVMPIEAQQIEPRLIAIFLGIPMLLILVGVFLINKKTEKTRTGKEN